MRRYPALPAPLREQLLAVPPSVDGGFAYRPCRLLLTSGRAIERAYVQEARAYHRLWGVWPEDDPGKQSISIVRVAAIEPSPHRLPAPLATRLYELPESGMGYRVFTLALRNGRRLPCVTGNAVDYVAFPPDVRATDVIDVRSGANGAVDSGRLRQASYAWCLYEER